MIWGCNLLVIMFQDQELQITYLNSLASDTIGDSALFEQDGGLGVSTNAIGNFALRLARPIGGASNVTSAINTGEISSGVSNARIWGTGVYISDSAAIYM